VGVSAAAHICAGRLLQLLSAHVPDRSGVDLYYGAAARWPRVASRSALPRVDMREQLLVD
jgi:hypothetical protein